MGAKMSAPLDPPAPTIAGFCPCKRAFLKCQALFQNLSEWESATGDFGEVAKSKRAGRATRVNRSVAAGGVEISTPLARPPAHSNFRNVGPKYEIHPSKESARVNFPRRSGEANKTFWRIGTRRLSLLESEFRLPEARPP